MVGRLLASDSASAGGGHSPQRNEAIAIAAWGAIVATRSDTQAVGPDTIVPVQRATVRTSPSGVEFDYLIPQATFDSETAELAVAPIAQQIEYYISSGQVAGAEYVEDLNDSGLVEFFIDFVVTIPQPSPNQPGPMTTIARVPLLALSDRILIDRIANPAIAAARDHLFALVGL